MVDKREKLMNSFNQYGFLTFKQVIDENLHYKMCIRDSTQPILKRKVEKVTKYDQDYIWGLVQDQFRREGFSETASDIAMTDFERIYQYALDNVRFVRRAEVLAEFVFNGLYSVWNNRVRKGGG